MAVNRPIVEILVRVGRRMGSSPAQVALAWLLARKPWIVPIPGTTKTGHLEEDLGAADLVLEAADVQEIETAFAAVTVRGARSSDAVLGLIDDRARMGTSSAGGQGKAPLPRKRNQ
jgi:diketogulonate reductase-like aldo/keto reductase